MKLNKYSESKTGSTVGAYSPSATSETIPKSDKKINREIWGQQDSGEDVNGSMAIDGNVYVGVLTYDEDENYLPPDHKFPSDSGNFWAESSSGSPEVYGRNLFLDIGGKKTNILDILMPIGSVIMFDGKATVPPGWAVCDGSNGTPDLRGKFIKGVDKASDVGKTGGASSATLSVENLPSHSHSAATNLNISTSQGTTSVPAEWDNQSVITFKEINMVAFDLGGDRHYTVETGYESARDKGIVEISVKDLLNAVASTSVAGTATTTVDNTGSGKAVSIEPPYYSLIFIMRIR